jgi:two-component system, cell cycle response regulator DivK
MLKKTGASINRAKTGKEALEMISNGMNISLVLLDLNMPDIHGYDILVEIKKSRKKLPVIIQTAYAMNGEKERCRKAGCDNYITKPIQVKQLISAVQKCLSRKDRVIRNIQ